MEACDGTCPRYKCFRCDVKSWHGRGTRFFEYQWQTPPHFHAIMQQEICFHLLQYCFPLQGNQNRVHCLMPIAVTACKVSQWVQQCCSMPWHTTLLWAWSACFLSKEYGVKSALMLGVCLAPCSFMVVDHTGHTSPQKEQLFTLLMHTALPNCDAVYPLAQVKSCAPAALSSARQDSWGSRACSPPDSHLIEQRWPLVCLMVPQLIEVTSSL